MLITNNFTECDMMLHPSCTSLSVKLSYFSTRMDPVQVCPTKSHPPKLPSPLALRRSTYSQSVNDSVWDGKRRGKRGKGKVFPAAEGQFPLPSLIPSLPRQVTEGRDLTYTACGPRALRRRRLTASQRAHWYYITREEIFLRFIFNTWFSEKHL